jgi:MurNAc alpha-1-phosphate uridylyltransferase
MKIIKAMVLAAGRGERMRPLTDVMPKPMIEVAGRSMVDRAIDRFVEAGINDVVVNTSYKAEMLEAHLAKRITPNIVFSREETALETGGGIAKALHHFNSQPFFAANGDIIWLDGAVSALAKMEGEWNANLDAMLLLHPTEQAVGYGGAGDFFYAADKGLTRRGGAARAPYVFAGVQLLHPRLFKGTPQGAFSMNVLYDKLIEQTPDRIRAIIHDGKWLHVGDIAGKQQAEKILTQ